MAISQDTEAKFEHALSVLRDPAAAFTADMIYGLSDLSLERLDALRSLWLEMAPQRRRDLVKHLVETAETNFDLDFSRIFHMALHDPESEVRHEAIEGVLEDSPLSVIERMMMLATEDPFSAVRAAAARNLGQFVLRGELGKLPGWFNTRLQDALLTLHNNPAEELEVRRRALEAIANCGREGVIDLIHRAYQSDDLPMRASAVFAMGRSYDESWTPHVIQELDSDEPELRYEAARAAGELELRQALGRLTELAYEDEREIQELAIWSIGEIGGKKARNILTEMSSHAAESGDPEFMEIIQDALSAAQLVTDEIDEELPPLFDFSEYDGDIDLDEDDEDDLKSNRYRILNRDDLAYGDIDALDDDEDDDDYTEDEIYDMEDIDPFDDDTY